MFDGSKNSGGAGAGIVIQSPRYRRIKMSFKFDFQCTNNQAEYEALIIGLKILLQMKASKVHIKGDSNLVIGQIAGDFKIRSWEMCPFHSVAVQLMREFDDIQVSYMLRECNHRADHMEIGRAHV